jgi:hypothetical protein
MLVASRAAAEPWLGHDAAGLGAGAMAFSLDGAWAASRGAYDDTGHPLGFSQTAGAALTRDLALEARRGLSSTVDVKLAGGWSSQEIKVDRGIGASGYLGSDSTRGAGLTDALVSLKWAPSLGADSVLGLEAGVTLPLARGPDRATSQADRLGTGGVSFPVGVRFTHTQGVIHGYFSGFLIPSPRRSVTRWYGAALSGRFRPGTEYAFSAGAEVRPATGPSWSVEVAKTYAGRETGDAALAPGLLPPFSALTFVPSVAVALTAATGLHLAALLPLDGRNVYQMIGTAASLRMKL